MGVCGGNGHLPPHWVTTRIPKGPGQTQTELPWVPSDGWGMTGSPAEPRWGSNQCAKGPRAGTRQARRAGRVSGEDAAHAHAHAHGNTSAPRCRWGHGEGPGRGACARQRSAGVRSPAREWGPPLRAAGGAAPLVIRDPAGFSELPDLSPEPWPGASRSREKQLPPAPFSSERNPRGQTST